MEDRAKIAAKIRALLEMTVGNGCTEAEAIAAAEKVAELLERYQMTLDEASLRASPFRHQEGEHRSDVAEVLWRVASAIGFLTGARWWTSARGVFPIQVHFFGLAHEVEVAGYLLAICERAMETAFAEIRSQTAILVRSRREAQRRAFVRGMAWRLAERIEKMRPVFPPGKGLVILRDDLLDQAMRAGGLQLRSRFRRDWYALETGYAEGRAAGDKVALNPGVGPGGTVRGLIE